MNATEIKLKYETAQSEDKAVPVIIVCAGNSSRMKGTNKQLLKLNGVPVIVRSCLKFQNSKCISRIILVTKPDMVSELSMLCSEYDLSKVSDIVEGGNCRTNSVLNGIKMLRRDEEKVLIHDGARPFVSEKTVEDVCKALNVCDCAVAALKVSDTVKKTDGEMTVLSTVNRDNLYLAQTPQGVSVNKYKSVLSEFDADIFTDDASVMEKGGYKTVIVEDSRLNIKITSREDILIAEAFSSIEEGGENI